MKIIVHKPDSVEANLLCRNHTCFWMSGGFSPLHVNTYSKIYITSVHWLLCYASALLKWLVWRLFKMLSFSHDPVVICFVLIVLPVFIISFLSHYDPRTCIKKKSDTQLVSLKEFYSSVTNFKRCYYILLLLKGGNHQGNEATCDDHPGSSGWDVRRSEHGKPGSISRARKPIQCEKGV